MMQQKEKKHYEAPSLTVVSFKIEQGYALSGLKMLAISSLLANDYGDQAIESRTNGGYWGNNDDGWF